MCNCADLPIAIADPGYWAPSFDYQGTGEFALYFRELDVHCLAPELASATASYRCSACGQRWYIECAPEETAWPLFALKYSDAMPSAKDIASHMAFLAVLAHRGFSSEKCLFADCVGLALNGRWICYAHLSAAPLVAE